MKIICLYLAVSFSFLTSYGQTAISLSQSNVPALGAGTIHLYYTAASGISAAGTGTSQAWDYSSLGGGASQSLIMLNAPDFSTTAVMDTTGFEFLTSTRGFRTGYVYDKDANGYYYGGEMVKKQGFSLFYLSGDNNDSITFPAQNCIFRENLIPFPTSEGISWITNYTHAIDFKLTVTLYNVKDVPCRKVTYTNVKDTVAGWGTLVIPSPNKASKPYPVLMVKRIITNTDSFMLAGSPAPGALLNAFGVVQGQKKYSYLEVFYREGSPQPLMTLVCKDNTYQSVSSASYAMDSVTSGILSTSNKADDLSVYPNPSASGKVFCRLNKKSIAPWTMTVLNPLGEEVKTRKISENGNITLEVNMANLNNGLYYLTIIDENGNVAAACKLNIGK